MPIPTLADLIQTLQVAAKWTPDCQGKQDYDGEFIAISCRYYPPSYNPVCNEPSCNVTIGIRLPDTDVVPLAKTELYRPTESELKAAVEQWVSNETKRMLTALMHAGYDTIKG